MIFKKKEILLLFLVLIFLAWSVVFYYCYNLLSVTFLDIGQGDSIFIETPTKKQILIDGGPGLNVISALNRRMPFWDREIDLVILTHPEHDHIRGLIEVLKHYKVKNILFTGISKNSREYKKWIREINKEEAKVFLAQSNQDFKIGQVELDILYPFRKKLGEESFNTNDSSIVIKLNFKDISFLLTGDITSRVERKIMRRVDNLNADVLKIAHHGSKFSSEESFIKKVVPELAIIQVGKNDYGHPAESVLMRLNRFRIPILRNDKDGEIRILSDGINLYY